MKCIADETCFYESPSPADVFCFTPTLAKLPGGRLVATFDFGGPGVGNLPGPHSLCGDYVCGNQCHVFISDDHGHAWRETCVLPMYHARAFAAPGNRVYLLGAADGLSIAVSHDNGETWSGVATLENRHRWEASGASYDVSEGRIAIVMEQRQTEDDWPGVAPVLMSAKLSDDLTCAENWTFSPPFVFEEHIHVPDQFGIPFYPYGTEKSGGRFCGSPGWLEVNVQRIHDPSHVYYDGRSVILLMRTHTAMTNIAAVARGYWREDGGLAVEPFPTPAGGRRLLVPFPGGHMRFHIVYDEISRLYWLAASQATDSMIRPELLGDDRYGLPDNERHRLVLYFSKNLFDWCFAGVVAIGASQRCSRHYASMVVVGDDLLLLSRSSDEHAPNPHNSNLLTLHRIPDFRRLVY